MEQELLRAKWRQKYAKLYPHGFPRRRNAEQKEKQLQAQRRYQQREPIASIRRLQKLARTLLKKNSKSAQQLVGCTHEELMQHLAPLPKGKWYLAYHKHPREFNLQDRMQVAACFHYSNMHARPNLTLKTSQSPSTQAP